MKIHFSLPKDEGFFQSYAHLGPTLRRLGILAQLISAATEIGVLYALAYAGLANFIPEQAQAAAAGIAILGTAFIEVGLRQFLPFSCRAILYRRFSGLHLPMSIFIFAAALGLIGASGFLSFKGSRELVATVAPPPALESTASADSLYQSEAGAIENRFSAQIAALEASAAAQVKVQVAALEKHKAREARTGRSYATAKERATAKIAAIEADGAGQIAALQSARAEELAQAAARRTAGRGKAEAANTAALEASAAKVAAWGLGAGWFTLFALAVLIVVIALDEVYRKGAGIETQALPNQYTFSAPIVSELLAAANERWNYVCRAAIQRFADSTPPPPEPKEAPPLWEYSPELKRRPIGFKPASVNNASAGSASVNNATVITQGGGHAKNCLHCGGEYRAKVAWQKYCGPACKEAHHAEKHGGQPFNPKEYHKGKR